MTKVVQAVIAIVVAALLFGPWLFFVIVRPEVTWQVGIPSGGYGLLPWVTNFVAFLLLLIPLSQRFSLRHWGIFCLGMVLDLGLGELMAQIPAVPLYLDSIGCVLVGALLGSTAGMASSLGASLLWGLIAPHAVVYAVINAVVGWLAGMFRQIGGGFSLFTAMVSGLMTGIVAAMLSAPLSLFVRNNLSGDPYSMIIEVVRELNETLLGPLSGIVDIGNPNVYTPETSDPMDKMVVFAVVFFLAPIVARAFRVPFED